MLFSHDPEVREIIQASRDAIEASRRMIAQSARERQAVRAVIRETRRLIEAARVDRAGRQS